MEYLRRVRNRWRTPQPEHLPAHRLDPATGGHLRAAVIGGAACLRPNRLSLPRAPACCRAALLRQDEPLPLASVPVTLPLPSMTTDFTWPVWTLPTKSESTTNEGAAWLENPRLRSTGSVMSRPTGSSRGRRQGGGGLGRGSGCGPGFAGAVRCSVPPGSRSDHGDLSEPPTVSRISYACRAACEG